jgi:hypothetical protein
MDHNPYFDALLRGERPLGDDYDSRNGLNRIPPDLEAAIWQVRRVASHAEDAISDDVEIIQNIIRWHGLDEIKEALRREPWGPGTLDLVERLFAVFDDDQIGSD